MNHQKSDSLFVTFMCFGVLWPLTTADKINCSFFPMIFSRWLWDFPVLFSVSKCISPFLPCPGIFIISQPGPVCVSQSSQPPAPAPLSLAPHHPLVPVLGSLWRRPRLAQPQPWEARLVWPQIISVRPRRNYHHFHWHVSSDISSIWPIFRENCHKDSFMLSNSHLLYFRIVFIVLCKNMTRKTNSYANKNKNDGGK